MQIIRTPVLTSFMIIFLILGFLSFRINSLKASFTKSQKTAYLKRFNFIRNITLAGVILFLVGVIVGLLLQFYFKVEIPYGSTSLLCTTIGTLCVTISSAIHYRIILKVRKQ